MSPFFSETGDSSLVVSSHFWIYWAVTVPLTIAVVLIWLVWLKWQRLKESKREGDLEKDVEESEKNV
jgi:hypothetical protein